METQTLNLATPLMTEVGSTRFQQTPGDTGVL